MSLASRLTAIYQAATKWLIWLGGRSKFYASFPFVVGRFHFQHWKNNRRLYPTVWYSSGKLLRLDLEYFEPPEGDKFFSIETLNDFTNASERLSERINAGLKVNFVIFVFLLAQYLSIELDMSIFGFTIKNAPGVTECLLLFTGISSFVIISRQRNLYLIDAARKSIIDKIFPEELRGLYYARYLSNDQAGPYFPKNLPHINTTRATSAVTTFSLLSVILLFLIPAYFAFAGANLLLVLNLWFNPSLGWVSKAICVYLIVLGVLSFLYLTIYRFYLPMRDRSFLHQLELAEQRDPLVHKTVLSQAYGPINRERLRLEREGYLKPTGPPIPPAGKPAK